MKKLYTLLALVTTLPFFASATGYNYLPPDIYIKQQEEKSALEYRIRTLETSLSNSPTLSILNIESRISQLEREMQTEINYVTGLYGGYGIANQLPDAIAKIEAKYESQINNLKDQKEEYEDVMAEENDLKDEIEKLKDQLNTVNETLSEMQSETVTTDATVDATEVPSAKDMFEYIDSLSIDEAGEIYGQLRVVNPTLYEEVKYLTFLKYPHGKPGSAMYDEYLETSAPPVAVVDVPKKTMQAPEVKNVIDSDSEVIVPNDRSEVEISTSTKPEPEQIIKPTDVIAAESLPIPEVERPTFVGRIVGFFKNLFSW